MTDTTAQTDNHTGNNEKKENKTDLFFYYAGVFFTTLFVSSLILWGAGAFGFWLAGA